MPMDLPKSIPPIVRHAAERAAQEVADASHAKTQAFSVYEQIRWHSRADRTDALRDGEATAIFDWALALRTELLRPFGDLTEFFKEVPPLPIVSHEIVLDPVDRGIPGGRLKTTLDLDFAEDRFLNFDDWFDGCRVTGGGTLNTRDAIFHSIHPEMLRQIHALIAEGQVWDRVIHGFTAMVQAYKDS